MIDYNTLIKNLDTEKIKHLLDELKIDYTETDSYLLMPTVCHHDDQDEASQKLYYYKDNKFFYCYTECGPMSIFKFLEHFYNARNISYDWYQDILVAVENCSVNSTFTENFDTAPYIKFNKYEKMTLQDLPVYSDGILQVFTKYYAPEWLNDGISCAAMDKFNIMYSISQNKIIIPHYNIHNELIGIRGRALNEWEVENIGKYAPIKIENKWYSHPLSLNLYGLNKTQENIKQYGYCILFEAEKSVLQMESFSMPNCSAAVCGSNLNKYSLQILLRSCCPKEVILAFDNEEMPNEEKYFLKLYNLCKKYSHICNFSFIYDYAGITKRKDSPTDRGEDIFKTLLSKRVKIR